MRNIDYKLKQDEAKYLFENTSKNLKEISIELNISRNTLQSWKQRYAWVKCDKYINDYKNNINSKNRKNKDENYNNAKNLYETTSMPVTQISKVTGYTKDMLWGYIRNHNWKRPDSLKKEVKSFNAKNNFQNLSKDKADAKSKNKSIANIRVWKSRSKAEKDKIVAKRLSTMQNKSDEEKQLIKSKISKSVALNWKNKSNEEKIKIRQKLSYAQQHLSPEVRETKLIKDRLTKHQNNSFKNAVAYDGVRFDSNYEKDVYEFCKRNNILIERDIPIRHYKGGKEYITYIDFRIDGILFECKGTHLLEGVYDYDKEIKIEDKLDIYKKNNVVLISSESSRYLIPPKNSSLSNGLKYLNKCPEPLICVDIDLFRNPSFPFAQDKPECFYKVSVDGKPSSLDAWNNELIRWNMIKNRINYVGGFIDSKSILTAMNVTRTCKQPSWFSKEYAKKLINKYITTDLIMDPFAGWGTRCDATLELNKQYIGGDMNLELVKWHQSLGRPIYFEDANNFKSDKNDCSVFICPPYTNYEKYFEGQDLEKTQCEWLNIVMNNIPNAKEYLMVCKIVDKGWEKYIVEEKINRSHLGTNKEYVLLVRKEP